MGKVKGKLSLFSKVTVVAARCLMSRTSAEQSQLKRTFSIIFASDKELWQWLCCWLFSWEKWTEFCKMQSCKTEFEFVCIDDRWTIYATPNLYLLTQQHVLQFFSLHNADHEPTSMMKFSMREHRSHRLPAARIAFRIRLAAFVVCFFVRRFTCCDV